MSTVVIQGLLKKGDVVIIAMHDRVCEKWLGPKSVPKMMPSYVVVSVGSVCIVLSDPFQNLRLLPGFMEVSAGTNYSEVRSYIMLTPEGPVRVPVYHGSSSDLSEQNKEFVLVGDP